MEKVADVWAPRSREAGYRWPARKLRVGRARARAVVAGLYSPLLFWSERTTVVAHLLLFAASLAVSPAPALFMAVQLIFSFRPSIVLRQGLLTLHM